jgi:hypothetical protein
MFQSGYILNPRDDSIWFLGLPFVAVAFALAAGHWLPFATIVAIHLWVTVPHHYATWLRTYGHRPDFNRFRTRLFVGPALIVVTVYAGAVYAPLTLFLLIRLWDTQHGLMQQHGFGRIYDFKAGTGAESTRRFDLGLHAVLYVNMMLATPLFTQTLWVPAIFKLGFSVTAAQVAAFHQICWGITFGYCVVYAAHVLWSLANGHKLNPVKYAFILASYFLWYYTAWQTNSLLIWAVAHRLMHGLQYIVMVHSYMQRQIELTGGRPGFVSRLFQRGHLHWFLGSALVYAAAYHLLMDGSLFDFGFGYLAAGSSAASGGGAEIPLITQIRVILVAEAFQLVHFYFDSFIWKVSDERVQRAL